MRAVIQRVSRASVTANGVPAGEVGRGLLVLLGVEDADAEEDVEWLCRKIVGLRIFDDAEGVMNLSVRDIGGGILLVSQFTLMADCQAGRRPSFTPTAPPAEAKRLYEYFVEQLQALGVPTQTGEFGAHMDVALINDGPVTFQLDSATAKISA